jgi:hypothetical protein
LFPPTPLVSVLGGLMCGATVLSPDNRLSVSRIVIVRLPAASARLRTADAYLPPEASMADDLATLGLPLADPDAVDQQLSTFLAGGGGGIDQISRADYQTLVEVFDRTWLARAASALA